jgi:N-acetyl-anhydromuramoyl-L-alanine amidase
LANTRTRITVDHWYKSARRLPSPNCDGPDGARTIELIVIHGISLPPGQFGGTSVEQLFTNTLDVSAHPSFASLKDVRVSAHLFIDRRGRVIQFVPFDQSAWHAGVSDWRGRKGCNRYSIGIELEGTDTTRYTTRQYESLAKVIRALTDRYPTLGSDGIVGHNEIAPGRKTDPGPGFDWPRLFGLLHQ